MGRGLTDAIVTRTQAILGNFRRVLETAQPEQLLCGMPLWKHIYHTFYWFDYWLAGPAQFCGAAYHEAGLESLDCLDGRVLTREDLAAYLQIIEEKTLKYLNGLDDGRLYEQAEGCDKNRFELILGQFRHVYSHLGNIHAMTILRTGKWPFVEGGPEDRNKGLYE